MLDEYIQHAACSMDACHMAEPRHASAPVGREHFAVAVHARQ